MTTSAELDRILNSPSAASWAELTASLDACSPGELDELVELVEPAIAEWPRVRARPWSVALTPDDLRVAPKHWVTEMAEGADSSKYRLVRAVNTIDLGLNATKVGKVLSCPSLLQLGYLHLCDVKLSKTLFKKLRTAPSTRTLEHLRLPLVDGKAVPGIEGEHHLENLREVSFDISSGPSAADIERFLSADALSGVEVINDLGGMFATLLGPLSSPTAAPNMRTLGVYSMWTTWIDSVMSFELATSVDTLRLGASIHVRRGHASATAIKRAMIEKVKPILPALVGVSHVDLSFFEVSLERGLEVDSTRIREAMRKALLACDFPSSIERVSLGPYYTDETAHALASHHSIDVVR